MMEGLLEYGQLEELYETVIGDYKADGVNSQADVLAIAKGHRIKR